MPVSFKCPIWYELIESFIRKHDLLEVTMDGFKQKKSVMERLQQRDVICDIKGLRSNKAEGIWAKIKTPGMTNRQQDIVWMPCQDILPVKEVKKKRDLVRSDVCPREKCGGCETNLHVF